MTPLLIISALVIGVLMAYRRMPRIAWATGLIAFGVLGHWLEEGSVWWFVGFWIPALIVLAAMYLTDVRQRLVTGPILEWFRKVLPPVSATEREAIDAGSVWWDAELFSGKPSWSRLLKLPAPALTAEEQAFLDGPTEELCRMLNVWQIHEELNDLPEEVWTFIRERGFLSMIIPKSYGGLGFSAQANSAVVMKISSASQSAAVTVMVPNSLGPGELLIHFGTEKQKDYYLPRLADGRELPCFALTGPYAGSDAAAMPDRGIVTRGTFEGKEVLGLNVTWNKRYITLAPVATVLGLAVKVEDPDALLGSTRHLGISCCLIPTSTPGVEIGERHFPTGSAFMNGPTSGEDVFIPLEWVIGGSERIGQGWRMLMYCLAAGRAISLPALGTAGAKLSLATTTAYARIREQFKVPIGQFEGVSEVIGRMAGDTYRMDAARELTAGALDAGEKPVVLSAILKYQLTEGYRRAVIDAMDVHAGKGIIEGPNNYLAKVYQAIPIAITVEGANILTRSLIVFGQGAIRCHPYLLTEMSAAADPDELEGLKAFDRALVSHIGFSVSNLARATVMGWTGARFTRTPVAGSMKQHFRRINHLSAAFAILADVTLLILGGRFKFAESLSGRFADVLSHLYLASAVLKRFVDRGQPDHERLAVEWAARDSLNQANRAIDGILDNFPSPVLAGLLRFSFGPRRLSPPSDRVVHELTQSLLSPGPLRDTLISGMYSGTADDPVAELEQTFRLVIESEPAAKAIRHALKRTVNPNNVDKLVGRSLKSGVITEEQANLLMQAQRAVAKVIAVDDFPPNHS